MLGQRPTFSVLLLTLLLSLLTEHPSIAFGVWPQSSADVHTSVVPVVTDTAGQTFASAADYDTVHCSVDSAQSDCHQCTSCSAIPSHLTSPRFLVEQPHFVYLALLHRIELEPETKPPRVV
ncbi:MAG: hypothetical protein H6999_01240 [Hahellaceae bacterium]|nr:hypothetical protein [Hahellaceae bacterium]MCP5168376.1 hypothetical protein [Hahellaceae bacterium]